MTKQYKINVKYLLTVALFLPLLLSAQTLIYQADFSGTGRTSGNNWTSSFTDGCNDGGFFGTRNGVFELRDIEGQGCLGNNQNFWIATIDISQFTNVEFIISASGIGNPFEAPGQGGADLFEVEVSVDGDRVYSDDMNLGGRLSVDDSFEDFGFCGEEMEITITFGTQSPDESLFIELVEVLGDRSPAPTQGDDEVEACVGSDALLEVLNANGATIIWEDENANQVGTGAVFSTPLFTNAQVGSFVYYYAIVDDPRCAGNPDPFEFEFEVEVLASLGEITILQDNDEFCIGEPIDLEIDVPFGNPNDYEYQWFLPDGSTVTTNRPFYTIPSATVNNDGLYEVIVFYNGNELVCEADLDGLEADADIFVLPSLGDIDITQDGDDFCAGDVIDLEVNISFGNPNDYEYQWFLPNGSTVTTNGPFYTIPNASANDDGLYEVIAFYNGNELVCESDLDGVEADADIFVLPSLGDIDIIQDGDLFCEGDPINLTVDVSFGNPNDYQYEWFLADGSVVTTNTPTYSVGNATLAADGLYEVLAFYNGNEEVCEDDLDDGVEADADIFVATRPSMPTINSTDICDGLPTLTVNIAQDEEIYWYNTPNVGGTDFLSASNIFTPSQAGIYYVVTVNEDGCESETLIYEVEEVKAVVAEIMATETTICQGATTILTASGGASYLWSTGETTNQIQVSSGNYSVTVIDGECDDTQNITIENFPAFEAEIVGDLGVCTGEATTLTASAGQTYEWSNGSTSQSISVGAGSYSVIVTNADGCTDEVQVAVSNFPAFEAEIVGSLEVCTGEATTLTASAGQTYEWSNGSTSQSISVGAGSYSVIVTNADGCTDEVQVAVSNFPAFEVEISGITEICEGTMTTLTATDGVDYLWNTGETTQFITAGAGTYSVIVTNADGCTGEQNITVNSVALPTLAITQEASCNDDFSAYELIVATETGNIISTNAGVVTELSAGNFSITDVPTNINLSITATNGNNCQTQQTITAPDCSCPTIAAPTTNFPVVSICEGEMIPPLSVGVNDSDLIVNWYDASVGGNLIAENTLNYLPTQAGIYYAQASSNSTGCLSTTRTAIELRINPLPNVEILSVTDITCKNDFGAITVNATSGTAPFEYSIETDIFQSSATFNNLPKGIYIVTIRDANGCENQVTATVATNTRVDIVELQLASCDLSQIGRDTTFLVNELGCDSLVINIFTDGTSRPTFLSATTCDLTQANDTLFLQNTNGCDSLVVTNYTFVDSDTTFLSATTCDLTQANDTLLLQNTNGCDSLVITAYEFVDAVVTTLSATTCDAEQASDTLVLQSAIGCDSLVVTNYTFVDSDTTFLSATTCDLTQANDTVFLQNINGCDSLVITAYEFVDAVVTTLSATTCDATQASDTLVLQSAIGCDSLVVTNYTFVDSDTTYISATSCDPAAVGEERQVLQNQAGCDSLVIITTTLSDQDVITFVETTCDPTLVGRDTAFFTNRLGCDSLIITETSLLGLSDTTRLERITCDALQVGLDTMIFQNTTGCDSVVITNSTFDFPDAPRVNISSNAPICEGDTVRLNVINYVEGLQWLRNGEVVEGSTAAAFNATEDGIYAVTYTNSDGCSVVSISFEVQVIPAPTEPFFSNVDNLLSLEKPEAFEGLSIQWYLDGAAIENATEPTYCAKASGTYLLEVTDLVTGCSTTHTMEVVYDASIENCNLVSTQTIIFDKAPSIYPNPLSDALFLDIELTDARVLTVQVINLLGKNQITQTFKTTNGKINERLSMSHLPNGIYWLRLEADAKVWLTKLIKQ